METSAPSHSSFNRMNVSFIVAAYNVEAYLTACLDKIIACAGDGDEIIVVNDGSTDNTPELITRAQQQCALVRRVDKVNGGLSSARNAGLAQATRQYVLFLDGDDVVRPEAVAQARQWLLDQAPDILVCDYLEWHEDAGGDLIPSRPRSHPPGVLSRSPVSNLTQTYHDCIPCVWTRFFKR